MNQDFDIQEVTDTRRIAFFMTDNALFDSGMSAEIGASVTIVYLYLLRRVNPHSECWPSRAGIMKATGLGRDTVTAAIEVLQLRGMIQRTDSGERYRFVILDKADWVLQKEGEAKKSPTSTGRKNRPGGRKNRLQPGEKIAPKNTQLRIHKEENTGAALPAAAGMQTELLTPTEAPPKLPGNLTADLWEEFKLARKKKRAPMTERAEKLLFKDLEQLILQGEDAQKVVEQSIKRAWTGLFPVRDPGERFGRQPVRETTWDEITEKTYNEAGRRSI